MEDNYEDLVREEFNRIGYNARGSDIASLSDSLRAQSCEFGEIGIMAACVGYATAKGLRFK